jgi:hypothetical protein
MAHEDPPDRLPRGRWNNDYFTDLTLRQLPRQAIERIDYR